MERKLWMMWRNVALVLGIALMLPIYRYMQQTHCVVQMAQSSDVWGQIPLDIPARADCINALQKQAKALSIKLKIQDSMLTLQALDLLPIYNFLHRMNRMPVLSIESFTMKREKGKVVAIIILSKSCISDRGSSSMIGKGSSIARFTLAEGDFYTPSFFYVNAAAEVDGQKQIWVNGRSYGPSCPWPLYHTFDKRTGMVKKGDLRPRLSLTSGT